MPAEVVHLSLEEIEWASELLATVNGGSFVLEGTETGNVLIQKAVAVRAVAIARRSGIAQGEHEAARVAALTSGLRGTNEPA